MSGFLMSCRLSPTNYCFFAQAADRFIGTCQQDFDGAAAAGRVRSVHLQPVHRTLAISCERQGAAGARCPSEARAGARLLHRLVRRRQNPQNHHGASPPRTRQIVRLILPTIVTHTMMEGVARRSHSSISQAWLRRPLNRAGLRRGQSETGTRAQGSSPSTTTECREGPTIL